jgi:hypothetical protein
MDTFYIVIPSNTPEVNNAAMPSNTISNFTVRLPNTVDLSEGEWSVAMSSIIYPVSFQADSHDELMSITIEYTDPKKNPKKIMTFPKNLSFSSIDHLEKTLNETLLGHTTQKTTVLREKRALSDPIDEEADEKEDVEEPNERLKRDEKAAAAEVILSEADKKLINTAANEVKVRSYIASQNLKNIIEEKITEIELLGAKAEAIELGIESRIVVNENLNKFEAQDIEHKIRQARQDAINLRNNAQAKRVNMSNYLAQYAELMSNLETHLQTQNVKEARILANQAKVIAKRLEEMKNYIDHDLEGIKILVDFLFETRDEVTNMLKPIDMGMKNTITRIKEAIMQKVGDKGADLELYFYFDYNFGRFFLYNHRPMEIRSVMLSPKLAYMLGFEIDKFTHVIKHIRLRREGGFAKFTPDIKAGVHQLYVYAPGLVESTYLGNVEVPLLRIVNVDKPSNSIAESIYSNPYYVKVNEKRISAIKIEIHDSFGQFVHFNWGNIIITLAFKRNLF